MSVITVMRKIELDVGHRVPFHESKCRNIHGHRYVVEATLAADSLIPTILNESEAEMVMDFSKIKNALTESIHDPYDHSLILWEHDEMFPQMHEIAEEFGIKLLSCPVIPTAEGLAQVWGRAFWHCLIQKMKDEHLKINISLKNFKVWETPNSYATYE